MSISAKPLAVSLGDPAGAGPEIIAKSWRPDGRAFAVLADPALIQGVIINSLADAPGAMRRGVPVLPLPGFGPVTPGQPNEASARAAMASLEAAADLCLSGAAAGLATAPVSKDQLASIGFSFPGQTEYLAHRCGLKPEDAVMMLAGPELRTVPLTIHIPLASAPLELTQALIISRARIVERALRERFGIARPRLVLAGLNPHAGENGRLGREELEVIGPAAALLRSEGIDIRGPLAADSLFHAAARASYDAALCPTHDQALIPVKALDFDRSVNVTLGLPFIRTSPDHGTAFDIAGRGLARPDSFMAALDLADRLSR